MSDSIKRYDMDSGYTPGTSMQVYTHGDYVRYEDHLAALQRAKDEAREECAVEADSVEAHWLAERFRAQKGKP